MTRDELLHFDPSTATKGQIIAAQAELVSRRFLPGPLGGDGEWGDGSKRALAGLRAAVSGSVVDVALSQVGAQESPDHNNDGPVVDLYLDQCGLKGKRAPWCACFVSWCLHRWSENTATTPRFTVPNTAAAWGFESYAGKTGAKLFRPRSDGTTLKPGDILMYTFSHVGILVSQSNGVLHVAEGNTNGDGSRDGYEVLQHPRYLSSVRSVLRLPF